MLHSGDIYETRARAARNRELRALSRALSGLIQTAFSGRQSVRKASFSVLEPVNDCGDVQNRAA
ncbi:hypothetical protein [Roseibium sp.]|uniref:hypothetical protein n=1 Tax=Roseibium sp. TaxID=1936156 RepID=UPI003BB132D8